MLDILAYIFVHTLASQRASANAKMGFLMASMNKCDWSAKTGILFLSALSLGSPGHALESMFTHDGKTRMLAQFPNRRTVLKKTNRLDWAGLNNGARSNEHELVLLQHHGPVTTLRYLSLVFSNLTVYKGCHLS